MRGELGLVLERKVDQVIMIGDGIKVTVVSIGGQKVRLAIRAPRLVPVHRLEVWDAIRREINRKYLKSKAIHA